MDIAMGDCPWEEPHPPHLWAAEMTFPAGPPKIKIWACGGTTEED